MSLVNQMLRDLEARKEREEAAAPREDVQAVRVARTRRGGMALLTGAIVVAVALGVVLGLHAGEWFGGEGKPAETSSAGVQASSAQSRPLRVASQAAGKARNGRTPIAPTAVDTAPAKTLAAVAPSPVAQAPKPESRAPNAEPAPPPRHLSPRQSSPAVHHAAPRMTKTVHPPTPAETAAAAYARGIAAARAGEAAEAEAQFHAALQADPAAYGAREALASLLSRQGRDDAAMQVLTAGMQADPSRSDLYARLDARLLAANNKVPQAIAILKAHLPAAHKAPAHYAFLAALQERQGAHAAAEANYLKALRANPDEGRWWAGLGVAYDQSRQLDKALAAYQRARRAGGLGVTLTAWVNQRIAALKP